MKTRHTLYSLLLILLPFSASAQLDVLAPGIYAIVNDVAIPLTLTRGTIVGFGYSVANTSTAYYKGDTSGVKATHTFVLVTDPKKGSYSDKYPFVKSLTPVNMRLLPLLSNAEKHRREYDIGLKIAGGLIYEDEYGLKFEWEKITDNSFQITIPDNLPAGEYGFSFCLHRLGTYDFFYSIFGFTLPSDK